VSKANCADGLGNRPRHDISSLTANDFRPQRNQRGGLFGVSEGSPDLAAIVEAWDRLPESIRQGIVAMIRSADGWSVQACL
jgi:hypothetical protein